MKVEVPEDEKDRERINNNIHDIQFDIQDKQEEINGYRDEITELEEEQNNL